jgi:hypothetical protein
LIFWKCRGIGIFTSHWIAIILKRDLRYNWCKTTNLRDGSLEIVSIFKWSYKKIGFRQEIGTTLNVHILEIWVQTAIFGKEISLNGEIFARVSDIGQLCVNAFDRMKFIASEKLSDLVLQKSDGPMVDLSNLDWKN